MNRLLIDIHPFFYALIVSITAFFVTTQETYAFNKLKNGFETITNNYLIPLSGAVAGAALITFVIVSYYKPEMLKRVGEIFVLSIVAYGGLEIMRGITESFS
jgi:mannitol-specific phosphotransferase system IIBC component